MASGLLIVCMVELVASVGKEGFHQYFKHRRDMIEQNRGDELVSSRIKKISSNLYNRMSRDNTPQKKIIKETVHFLDEIIGDHIPNETENVIAEVGDGIADVFKDEISDLEDNVKEKIKEVIEHMPLVLPKKQRKSILGFNPLKVSEIITNVHKRFKTPTKSRELLPEPNIVLPDDDEFQKFINTITQYLKDEIAMHDGNLKSNLKQRDYEMKMVKRFNPVRMKDINIKPTV